MISLKAATPDREVVRPEDYSLPETGRGQENGHIPSPSNHAFFALAVDVYDSLNLIIHFVIHG